MVLTLILIVSSVALALGLSLKLQTITETDIISKAQAATANFAAAQGCLEEAMLRLNRSTAYRGGAVVVGTTTCTITVSVFPAYLITVTASRGDLVKKLQGQVTVNKYNMLLTSWKEIP